MPNAEAWIVCDHRAIRRFGLGALGPAPLRRDAVHRSGYIKTGATIEALAAACGIDPAGLAATVARFNSGARIGVDPEFQRGTDAYQRFNGSALSSPNPCVAALDTGPFMPSASSRANSAPLPASRPTPTPK